MKRPFIAAFIFSLVFFAFTSPLLANHVSGYSRKDGTYVSGYNRGGSNFGGVDLPSWVIPFLVILAIFIVVTLILAMTSKQGKRISPEAVQQNAVAAEGWLKLIQNGTFKPPNTPVLLRENETAILNESCQLMEAKGTRIYGGTGTRIKGIYVGGGASQSFDSLSGIDSGTLTLTNQRVVFTGSMQSRLAELNKIVSLKSFSDAIEIASGKTSKSQVYVVGNPILWERVIKLIISGHFQIQKVENQKPLANPVMSTIENVPNASKIHYPNLVGSDVHFECKFCGQPIEVN
jgi:hypothetical protein